MDVSFTSEQQTLIESLVSTGRFASAQEAVSEGLRLLESNEKLRQEIQPGIDELDAGLGIPHEQVFAELRERAKTIEEQAK